MNVPGTGSKPVCIYFKKLRSQVCCPCQVHAHLKYIYRMPTKPQYANVWTCGCVAPIKDRLAGGCLGGRYSVPWAISAVEVESVVDRPSQDVAGWAPLFHWWSKQPCRCSMPYACRRHTAARCQLLFRGAHFPTGKSRRTAILQPLVASKTLFFPCSFFFLNNNPVTLFCYLLTCVIRPLVEQAFISTTIPFPFISPTNTIQTIVVGFKLTFTQPS